MIDSTHGVVTLERPNWQPEPRPRPTRDKAIVAATLGYLVGSVPTILVLVIAGGIGWWGHHSGWTLPKFSELNGQVAPADDWCAEHKVPESICVECDPTLMPRPASPSWCKIHGVPGCVLDHPNLAQLPGTPSVTPATLASAAGALAFTERAANNPICRTHLRRIQFATAADADKAGVEVEPVWTAPVVESVRAPGEVGYDQTKVAHLSPRAPGTVRRVYKHLGDAVKPGDVLALIDASLVGKAKAELLVAFADLQLKSQILASYQSVTGSVPKTRLREADAATREAEVRVSAACQALTNLGLPLAEAEARGLTLDQLKARLRLLGIPADVAKTLETRAISTNLLPLVSPIDGTVVSFEVVAGEVVSETRILFEVVDTHSLWLTLDLKAEDARRVRVGQTVRFRPDGGQAEVAGTIAYKSGRADPKTRTIQVRADLNDPEGRLPANTYGEGRVILREQPEAITVPTAAVQWDGDCNVVFVRDVNYLNEGAPKVFHVRKVRVGAVAGQRTEVVNVLPGELVVTRGSGLLLTELLSDALGEGCACHSQK